MWLVTDFGFYSIVRKPGDNFLTIRTRVCNDLENLKKLYLPTLGDIIDGGGTDYQYRAEVPHADFANAMSRIVMDIDYSNFKNEVSKKQSSSRAKIYGKVWGALSLLEQGD